MSKLEQLLEGVEVEWKTLGEVAELKRGTTITAKTKTDGNIPVISGGQSPAYYNSEYNRDGETITVAGSGAYAGYIMFWNKPIFVSDAFSVKPNLDILNSKYAFYFLLNNQAWIHNLQKGSGVPHVYPKDLANLQIPIPPLPVQAEIVRILDTFTELTADLTAELTAELTVRKKQYKYYREVLLSFEDEEVEWKPLEDVYKFQYGTGNTIPTTGGEYPVYGSNGIVGTHSEYNSEDSPVIGHIGAYAGIVNFGKGKHFVTYNGVICKLINEKVNSRYGYHQLLKQDFNALAKNSSQPFVSYKELNAVKIPIPSIKEQERIVTILDKFDILTTSISEGLPKEIELRKKQYEYYRDKLLTFNG